MQWASLAVKHFIWKPRQGSTLTIFHSYVHLDVSRYSEVVCSICHFIILHLHKPLLFPTPFYQINKYQGTILLIIIPQVLLYLMRIPKGRIQPIYMKVSVIFCLITTTIKLTKFVTVLKCELNLSLCQLFIYLSVKFLKIFCNAWIDKSSQKLFLKVMEMKICVDSKNLEECWISLCSF